MKKLNIAILGTGSIASGGHAPALLQSEHAQLWSVLSRDSNRAQQFAKQFHAQSSSPAHTSLESLLADPELDAVIVATPANETILASVNLPVQVIAKLGVFGLSRLMVTLRPGHPMVREARERARHLAAA